MRDNHKLHNNHTKHERSMAIIRHIYAEYA